jgi:hypothetical protein
VCRGVNPSTQPGKLRGDDLLVGHLSLPDADVAGELVHAGDEFRRDRREVTADQFGNQLGRGSGKELAADFGCAADIGLERGLSLTRVRTAVVRVTRIDRLARSTFDLFGIVKQIVDAKRNSVPWPRRVQTPVPAPGG